MLEVALRHQFPGFALDVAFAAPAQGVTALFGPSGCGKTTVLNAIAGLLRADAGRIRLGGETLFDSAAGRDLPAEARRCGVVFQEARLFPHLGVAANLRYGLRRAPPGATGPRFDEVVALLGLDALLDRRPARLSGGERQRVALGRALLSRPRLLLMDEPLAALDTARREEILPFLARLRDQAVLPILYVTHALDEVDALADRLVLLQAGRVLADDTLEALTARTDLPLARRRDAGVVLACVVLATEGSLTRLGFPGGELFVPRRAAPPGSRLRVRLRARDVVIATQAPVGLSTSNMLPCVIEAINDGPTADECFLRLALGPSRLLARLSREAVARLALHPGQPVFALVKAVALDQVGSG